MAMAAAVWRSSNGRSRGPDVQTTSNTAQPSPLASNRARGGPENSFSDSTAIFAKIPGPLWPYNNSVTDASGARKGDLKNDGWTQKRRDVVDPIDRKMGGNRAQVGGVGRRVPGREIRIPAGGGRADIRRYAP